MSTATAKETIDELLEVLATERAAIRRLDANVVEAASRQKEALAQTLSAREPSELLPIRGEIMRLRAELRRNGVLLAHARACLKEVVEIGIARRGRPGALRARL